jgi:glutamate N-acetyltransferase/amino-acid N-acetyltransferase
MNRVSGGVTAARGFLAAGVHAGVKRGNRPDLALVASEGPAVCAATFTKNKIQAAPVVISRERAAAGRARAVLLNSGCANCLTGRPGLEDALRLSRAVSGALGIPDAQLLLASTGVISHRLPVDRMLRGVPALVKALSPAGHRQAAIGIQTTDCTVKEAAVAERIGGARCAVGGMAKGAGMIAPEMATMLAVLTTDVRIAPALLRRQLREAVGASFNRISVDGDMSTNDSVFVLASGASGVRIEPGTKAAARFGALLTEAARQLARAIVEDGEGATRVARIVVQEARTEADARDCARRIASSLLVRTMLAGADPNFGRVAAAVGVSTASFVPERLVVLMNGRTVVSGGHALEVSPAAAREIFAPHEIEIRIRLRAGRASAEMLTCDLTEEYVRLNTRYVT